MSLSKYKYISYNICICILYFFCGLICIYNYTFYICSCCSCLLKIRHILNLIRSCWVSFLHLLSADALIKPSRWTIESCICQFAHPDTFAFCFLVYILQKISFLVSTLSSYFSCFSLPFSLLFPWNCGYKGQLKTLPLCLYLISLPFPIFYLI